MGVLVIPMVGMQAAVCCLGIPMIMGYATLIAIITLIAVHHGVKWIVDVGWLAGRNVPMDKNELGWSELD